jgi:hypothetical protein
MMGTREEALRVHPTPLIFASVASKRLSSAISPLSATLTSAALGVDSKVLNDSLSWRDGEAIQPPLPPMFLKRYDSKRVSGWRSVNDMIP